MINFFNGVSNMFSINSVSSVSVIGMSPLIVIINFSALGHAERVHGHCLRVAAGWKFQELTLSCSVRQIEVA